MDKEVCFNHEFKLSSDTEEAELQNISYNSKYNTTTSSMFCDTIVDFEDLKVLHRELGKFIKFIDKNIK